MVYRYSHCTKLAGEPDPIVKNSFLRLRPRSRFQQLLLPTAHLVRVQVVRAGKLIDRPQPFGCFRRYFELELCYSS